MKRTPYVHLILGLAAFSLITAILALYPLNQQAFAKDPAAPHAQYTYIPTPTPGTDGRIVYIVQAGDSPWSIAARYGFIGEKYNELRALNKWGDNPVLNIGDEVILGYAGPVSASPTVGPSPTAQPLLPTPSPQPGWGNLCIMVYEDVNGDSLRQEEEGSILGSAISVSDRFGSVSETADSAPGLDPVCFEELPEGFYNITVAVPDDFNATTDLNLSIDLGAGDTTILDFGAQKSTRAVSLPAATEEEEKSPILGIVGGGLLAVGVGLGLFAGKLMSTKAKAVQKKSP